MKKKRLFTKKLQDGIHQATFTPLLLFSTIVSIICCRTKARLYFLLKAFLFYNIWIYSQHCEDELRTAFLFFVCFLYTGSQAPHDDKTLHKARCISPHLSRNQEHGILNLYKDLTHDAAVGTPFTGPAASVCSGFICLQGAGWRGGGVSVVALTMGTDSWFTKRRSWSPPPHGHYTQLACS